MLVSCGGGDGTLSFGNTQTIVTGTGSQSLLAFETTLAGSQQAPASGSLAAGSGTLVVDTTSGALVAAVATAGISGTAAAIHQGPPGVNGPVILPLSETRPGSGVWSAMAALTQDQLNVLAAGGMYLNVRSLAFPNGEIRGQIVPRGQGGVFNFGIDSTTGLRATLTSVLTGAAELPPVTSAGKGAGTAVILGRTMVAAVATSGVAGTAANILDGTQGVNGPIAFPLTETSPGSGVWFTSTTFTDAQLNALTTGNMFFNVQSAAFPGGEIRGSILLQQSNMFSSNGIGTTGIGTVGTSTTSIGTTGIGTIGTGTFGGMPGNVPIGTGLPDTGILFISGN
jgi:hypothetical protein